MTLSKVRISYHEFYEIIDQIDSQIYEIVLRLRLDKNLECLNMDLIELFCKMIVDPNKG